MSGTGSSKATFECNAYVTIPEHPETFSLTLLMLINCGLTATWTILNADSNVNTYRTRITRTA